MNTKTDALNYGATKNTVAFSCSARDIDADVVIIGGFSGINTALELA